MSARWIFSRRIDLLVFTGTALVALALVALGPWLGVGEDGDSPAWTWLTGILLVDVAHVYSTAIVVYLDPIERRRRRAAWMVPLFAYAAGALLYSEGAALFWRALAYLAVVHFVRQQWGWVALYRRKAGETDRRGRWLDAAAVYAATIYPLIYWHAHLPRQFHWFVPGDFAALPGWAAALTAPIYWAILAVYLARALPGWLRGAPVNPGKDLVVAGTWACWYVGIVALDSDYAFTVTNVFIHGVPYLALVFLVARAPTPGDHVEPPSIGRRIALAGPPIFLATLWLAAYLEELVWDRAVWHEHGWLFGGSLDLSALRAYLIPLLAVPQITHYVLDAFLWRGEDSLARRLRAPPTR